MTDYFLLGVMGAGMSVVAQLLAAQGHQVAGADRSAQGPASQALAEAGVKVYEGHDPELIKPEMTIIRSSAIRADNPQIIKANELQLPILHRSEGLALAAAGKQFVAVAGAHGKTTTSGMLSSALTSAGLDPSFAVGSIVKGFGSGARLGQGPVFVAEADESDGSFLNYEPTIEIVTGVEPDHLDYYGTFEGVKQAFQNFAERLVPEGTLIAFADDPGAAELAQKVREAGRNRVLTYGQGAADVQLAKRVDTDNGQEFEVSGVLGSARIKLRMGGLHNALNATAAWIAGRLLGVEAGPMAQALNQFEGTARRFDPVANLALDGGEVRIFDDYAHHPTEVAMALKLGRQVAGEGRLVVAFQPHLYSRTAAFAAEFAQALSLADQVYVLDIYAAREDPRTDINAQTITQHLEKAVPSGNLTETAQLLAQHLQAGDTLVTMGAGDVTKLGPLVVAEVESTRRNGDN
ncbi:UDP-N-acetylmuramate--L-alanine ligase [Boudabousia liubingyangii]|uniref:UDP-N-acetylmuramate--L-alanine ligase n=1 Tax=Boudabousia liubingyangii TaxID=1921764 RepID=A0A1Q5PN77_9ACTO|nr:UDP-N-acetylmuramate--L-alanine ligase [Boudabousia liubingyangii]OKL48969.1 UDP-N-acetylmuramate--L-alanine ligase [Boudabousia liubingyangii]